MICGGGVMDEWLTLHHFMDGAIRGADEVQTATWMLQANATGVVVDG
jgi:hypothetical protein